MILRGVDPKSLDEVDCELFQAIDGLSFASVNPASSNRAKVTNAVGFTLALGTACVLISSTLAWSGATTEPVTIADVATAQQNYFDRIKSLDITYTMDMYRANSPTDQTQLRDLRTVRAIIAGNEFRIELGIDDSVVPPRSLPHFGMVYAFNGKQWQQLNKRDIGKSTKVRATTAAATVPPEGYSENIPIFQSYDSLMPDLPDRTLETLGPGAEIWKQLPVVASVTGDATFAGHPCVVVAVHLPKRGAHRWYLARDLDLLPLGSERFFENGNTSSRFEVETVRTIQTDRGPVMVPTTAKWNWFADTDAHETTMHCLFTVNDANLFVNQKVDEKIFTIDPNDVGRDEGGI